MSAKKTTKPAPKAAKKPAAKPAPKATKKPAAKPAPKAAKKPAAKPAPAKPAAAKKPAAKPAPAKPAAAKKPAPAKKSETAAKSVQKAAKKPAAKAVEVSKPAAAAVSPAPVELERRQETADRKAAAKVPPKIMSRPQIKNPPPLSQESIEQFEAEREEQCKVALQIALRMKQRHQKEAQLQEEKPSIKLSRRPTTRAAGKNTAKFPDADLKRFRKSLLEIRDALLGRSGALKTAALERNDERTAEDDDGTDAFMRLQALGQVGDQNRTIAQIDEALRKIEDGSYGVCEMCGQLIRKQRLEHLPFARTCMECQSEVEKPFGSR